MAKWGKTDQNYNPESVSLCQTSSQVSPDGKTFSRRNFSDLARFMTGLMAHFDRMRRPGGPISPRQAWLPALQSPLGFVQIGPRQAWWPALQSPLGFVQNGLRPFSPVHNFTNIATNILTVRK